MKLKFFFLLALCVFLQVSLCSCLRLPSAVPDTTDGISEKELNASIEIGGRKFPSTDGRGFAKDFPRADVLDEEKRVVKGIDYVLYNGEKKLIEGYSEYTYDENGNISGRKRFDTLGEFVAEYGYAADEATGKTSECFEYDKNGVLIKRTTYTYERVLCRNYQPFYDMLEKVVTEYDGNGSVTGSYEYEYFDTIRAVYPKKKICRDANGQITKVFEFDETGDYSYLHIYENGELAETKKIE